MTHAHVSAKTVQASAPRLWLVVGDKLGDNAQAEIIIEALGWPYVRKSLRFKARYEAGKPRYRPSLHHVDLARSDPLEPPWPDVILTVGRRPAMAAWWVREQSGRRTKLVLIGRPRRGLEPYSLIVVSPQFRVPALDKVLQLRLPLMRVDQEKIAAAAEHWRDRLADLPRPLTAVLVGGVTRPYRLDADVARDLVRRTAEATGGEGTLYFTTSRRTGAGVAEALEQAAPAGSRVFRWSPEAEDNPYLGLLALADRFVVTGDSISMMTEVARLNKPLAIYPLPVHPSVFQGLQRIAARLLLPTPGRGRPLLKRLGAVLYRLGAIGYVRDLGVMHERLIADGLAVRLGVPFPTGLGEVPDSLDRVVDRIRALAGDFDRD
ncbi:MAG TPA: ELM1/GtrOC1 family putative glycosyltransferase [Kiloniellales bacterium]